ncbi:hypothetical protein [Enorma phocaeensis]|uniref:Uncharacterized protein n=1 Tax=Enorma phocaeensis TaxID=1871019 RepID=A0A921IWZ6_9ACTN|nr:hypothetical protein [Enorma phocaeensis]HJG37799.1 hypothetical protein [Enorma phocaeensis]
MADTLASTDWSKTSKLVVRNAETGEEIALITDQALIEDAVSGLSDINSVAAEPDASPEYVVEVWQPETIRFGETEPSGDTCVLELTTYQDSDVVGLSVSLLDISLYMHAPTTAEELRTLAQ